jgi:hypothetical protein
MRALGYIRRKPPVETKKEEVTAQAVKEAAPVAQENDSSFDESVVIN